MESQADKQIALQKAISNHEQAEASIVDLQKDGANPAYTVLLERVQANLETLRADHAALAT
ncbi:MAG TPA: hypothetical protein VFQ39_09435 [Longimicrobium sp.]|nr:hypothetical protein [Longimicrobium sp.]